MKIAVYAIAKQEAKHVKRFCDSASGADYIVIADTGSTDDTVQIARDCGASVYSISINPWRFDTARNAALALVPGDADVCVSLDLDEVLEPGWREEIERLWVGGVTRLRHRFDFTQGHIYEAQRVHARHGYIWKYPCHEFQVIDPRLTEVMVQSDKVLITHMPDKDKSRSQYLPMLEMAIEENPDCTRSQFYYARELYYASRWTDVIPAYEKYLKQPDATWTAERCYALRIIAECYHNLRDYGHAEAYYLKSCAEYPAVRDPWLVLARFYYARQNWAECYSAACRLLRIKERNYEYVALPESWGHEPYDLAALAAWNLGLKDQAAHYGREALRLSPNDPRLIENMKWYEGDKDGVPNIVHFIHFSNDNRLCRPFSYVNYLAVKSASEIQKPDNIFVYYNVAPENNPHWISMASIPGVSLVHMEPPTEHGGVTLSGFPQYQADVVRLQKLYEMGGVYMDTDAITLKPLNEFFKHDCVISGFNIDNDDIETNNSTIIARKGSAFIKHWLERMPDSLRTGVWAHHCARLPAKLCSEYPDKVTLLDNKYFLPYHYYDDSYLKASEPEDVRKTLEMADGSYVVHLWETFWDKIVPQITSDFVHDSGTPIAHLLKRFA